MSGSKQRRMSKDERRARLLEAAVDAIRTYGASASMEQLATAGGVTKPILYRHFGDRDGLIIEIGEQFAARMLDRILGRLSGDDDPHNVLRATVDAYLQFIEEDPELYRFLVSQVATTGPGGDSVGGLIDAIARQVALVIGDGLRTAGLDAGAAEPWAFGIVGMVHQTGDWWLRTRTMRRSAVTDYITRLLWDGIDPSRAPDQTPPD